MVQCDITGAKRKHFRQTIQTFAYIFYYSPFGSFGFIFIFILTEALIQIDSWSIIRIQAIKEHERVRHLASCSLWTLAPVPLGSESNILANPVPCLDTSKYRTHLKCKTCSLKPFYKLNCSSLPQRYLITCVCLASIFIANYILMLRLGCHGQVRVQCSCLQQLCSVLFCSIKPLIGCPCKFGWRVFSRFPPHTERAYRPRC
jgi:hypothetical protein